MAGLTTLGPTNTMMTSSAASARYTQRLPALSSACQRDSMEALEPNTEEVGDRRVVAPAGRKVRMKGGSRNGGKRKRAGYAQGSGVPCPRAALPLLESEASAERTARSASQATARDTFVMPGRFKEGDTVMAHSRGCIYEAKVRGLGSRVRALQGSRRPARTTAHCLSTRAPSP